MLKFIEGDRLVEEFHDLMKESATADLAVAFWGQDSARRLNIRKGSSTRIICNLESGACNPKEIRKLRGLVNVKTHEDLHAKVYCTENGAIVGSSNASTNGLAILASDAPGWREANIVVDDREILAAITEWFNKIWGKARTIRDSDLLRAEKLWKNARAYSLNIRYCRKADSREIRWAPSKWRSAEGMSASEGDCVAKRFCAPLLSTDKIVTK